MNGLRTFYSTLGMAMSEEKHGNGPVHFAGRAGDVVFEIYPLGEAGAVDTSTRLGFDVARLDVLMETLRSSGVTIVKEPESTKWGRRAVVLDPDGRSIEIYQR